MSAHEGNLYHPPSVVVPPLLPPGLNRNTRGGNIEHSSRRKLDGAMSPSSEVAFDKVMRHIASKVWNDEKDAELLKELESVLDTDTYNAIRTPFQSDVATTTTAVNKVMSSSIQTTHHNIDGKIVPDENIVVEDEGNDSDNEDIKFDFWGEPFQKQLLSKSTNVTVSGSRAAMLVSLHREVEQEEEDAKPSSSGTGRTQGSADGVSNCDEDSEDEWDDDNDDGYIAVTMSLKEFLIMETSNMEDLKEHSDDIRPSSVWIQAREQGVEETCFSIERFEESPSEDDAENNLDSAVVDRTSLDFDNVHNGSASTGETRDMVEPAKVEDTASFEAPYDDFQLDPLNDAQDVQNGQVGLASKLYIDGGFLDTSTESQQLIEHEDDDRDEPEYEAFDLKIVHERHKTGFEAEKDLKLSEGYVVAGRYVIESMVGEASFSTAWKAIDRRPGGTSKRVCLKVIKNNKDFFDQSMDEIKLLRYLNAAGNVDEHHILRLYDYFYFKEHLFIVTELLRDNLYEFSRYNRESGDTIYFNLRRIRMVAKQCLEALDYMHRFGLIHCDLKPENILIKSYSNCEVKVIDFGSSCYITDHLTSYIQSRSYRAPEVLLGCTYGQKIDLWSLGCILAELWTGTVLFYNHSVASLLSRIIAIIGPFPKAMLRKGANVPKYFTASNRLYESSYDIEQSDQDSDDVEKHGRNKGAEEYILLYPKKTSLRHRLRVNYDKFIDFMERLLKIDPKERMSTRQALQHPFLQ